MAAENVLTFAPGVLNRAHPGAERLQQQVVPLDNLRCHCRGCPRLVLNGPSDVPRSWEVSLHAAGKLDLTCTRLCECD